MGLERVLRVGLEAAVAHHLLSSFCIFRTFHFDTRSRSTPRALTLVALLFLLLFWVLALLAVVCYQVRVESRKTRLVVFFFCHWPTQMGFLNRGIQQSGCPGQPRLLGHWNDTGNCAITSGLLVRWKFKRLYVCTVLTSTYWRDPRVMLLAIDLLIPYV